MNKVSYKYLSIISFKSLFNWSVKSTPKRGINFKEKFQKCKIKSFLKRSRDLVTIIDTTEYNRVTVRLYGKGILIRDSLLGKFIGLKKQYRIKSGQFLLSRIDARNGAFGIVPESCNNCIITNDFWAFDINEDIINPQFLFLVTATKQFSNLCQLASSGTTNRQRVAFEFFENTEIPLPPIGIQKEFIKKYNDKIKLAEEQEFKALQLENDIEQFLFSELDVDKQTKENEIQNKNLLSFTNLKKLSRWGVEYLKTQKSDNTLLKSRTIPMKKLGSIVEIDPKNNFSALNEDLEMSFIPMQCISDENGEIIKLENGINKKSKGYTRFKEGDLIWAKITPCMQNGKSAILKGLKNGYGYGSTEFYVIRNLNSNICLDYIYHILRTKLVRQDAVKYFTGSSGQQRVPKSYLQNLEIPLPDFDKQKNISNQIYTIKMEIKNLKQEAEQNRITAQEEFEKELFE